MSIFLKNFTKLNDDEITLVLNARNSKKVRKASKNQQTISLNEHKAFINNLKQDNTKKYFLVYIDEIAIGVVSFVEIDGDIYVGVYAIESLFSVSIYYLEYIYFIYVFEIIKADKFYAQILASNKIYLKTFLKHKAIENVTTVDENTTQISFSAKKYFDMDYKNFLQTRIKNIYADKACYDIMIL